MPGDLALGLGVEDVGPVVGGRQKEAVVGVKPIFVGEHTFAQPDETIQLKGRFAVAFDLFAPSVIEPLAGPPDGQVFEHVEEGRAELSQRGSLKCPGGKGFADDDHLCTSFLSQGHRTSRLYVPCARLRRRSFFTGKFSGSAPIVKNKGVRMGQIVSDAKRGMGGK